MARAAFPSALATFASAAPTTSHVFSAEELRLLEALVDVILPETDSPAASAAQTHRFIDVAADACATPAEKQVLRAGLADLGRAAREQHQRSFAELAPEAQAALLRERGESDASLPYDKSFFKILKDYTLVGYFHSEIGATQALAYDPVPGGYQADIPLELNQKAWTL